MELQARIGVAAALDPDRVVCPSAGQAGIHGGAEGGDAGQARDEAPRSVEEDGVPGLVGGLGERSLGASDVALSGEAHGGALGEVGEVLGDLVNSWWVNGLTCGHEGGPPPIVRKTPAEWPFDPTSACLWRPSSAMFVLRARPSTASMNMAQEPVGLSWGRRKISTMPASFGRVYRGRIRRIPAGGWSGPNACARTRRRRPVLLRRR